MSFKFWYKNIHIRNVSVDLNSTLFSTLLLKLKKILSFFFKRVQGKRYKELHYAKDSFHDPTPLNLIKLFKN